MVIHVVDETDPVWPAIKTEHVSKFLRRPPPNIAVCMLLLYGISQCTIYSYINVL